MVEDLAAQPSASVPPASRDPAALQGTDDFWQSPRGKASAIVSAHGQSPLERMVGTDIGLAIQDPTEFNFTTHPQRPGVGYLDHPKSRGVKHHSGWAVSGQGVPVGLLHQHLWGRALAQLGKTQQRRQRPTPAQESQRWLDCWQQTKPIMPPPSNGGMVGDREADFYDLFALAAQQSCPILGRAAQDRLVQTAEATETTWLKATLAALPVMGPGPILLKRHPERPERLATLTIRCTTLELQPPQSRPPAEDVKPLRVQAILAQALHPPVGEDPVVWLLFTTLPVVALADARQGRQWDADRGLIERYHCVRKSGCRLEQLQLETTDRLERAIATYAIVAWRWRWLTDAARRDPDQSAETAFATAAWQALYCTIHQTPWPPDQPPTLGQCVRWMAQLGGCIGRNRDGYPGVKTLWLGLRRLHDIVSTCKLLKL